MDRIWQIALGSGPARLRLLAVIAAMSTALIFLVRFGHDTFFGLFPESAHFVFHTFAEFTSIVLSFAIFAIGWYGYKQRPDSRNLALALTFFAVGLLDFAHAFSFPEMPVFLTPNSLDKAATFFVTSQVLAALGLLSMSLIPARAPMGRLAPYALLAGTAGAMAALGLIESYRPDLTPVMITASEEATPFQLSLWGGTVALQAFVIAVLQKKELFNPRSTLLLQAAMMVAIFSDLPFLISDQTIYDRYFVSHMFNAAAYYLILRAIFVSSLQQPYKQLERARESLEESFGSIGAALTSSLELDKALSLIAVLSSDLLESPHALVALKDEGRESMTVRASRGLAAPPGEILLNDNLAGLVWRTRKPVRIDDTNDPSQSYRSVIAAAEGLDSAVAAPILRDGVILGEIAVYSEKKAAFDDADGRLLAAFARQAAVAIENARLFESELSSRDRIESYVAQLSILHNISLQLNRETDTRRLLDTVLKGAMQMTSAGVGMMALIKDDKTDVLALHYADWYEQRCGVEADTQRLHSGVSRLIAGKGRESLRITDLTEPGGELHLPAGHLGLEGLLVGTIRDTRGRVKGHFMVSGKEGGREFTMQDEEIISLLAAQSSVALTSAENFEREHYVAESLQSALLPTVPRREDLEVGLLYQSAGAFGKVGGDYYDFVELDENRIAVVVGDVCGKGIEAATYTAMIKYMLRAYLSEGLDPAECLTRLNAAIADQIAPEKFITACLAIIDPAGQTMIYASAGHPPPVICRPDRATTLATPGAVPLGVLVEQIYSSSRISIADICQIILYSDGLIEARPPEGEPFGERRVAETVKGTCGRRAQQVAEDLVAAAMEYSGGSLRDDIALLVVRVLSVDLKISSKP